MGTLQNNIEVRKNNEGLKIYGIRQRSLKTFNQQDPPSADRLSNYKPPEIEWNETLKKQSLRLNNIDKELKDNQIVLSNININEVPIKIPKGVKTFFNNIVDWLNKKAAPNWQVEKIEYLPGGCQDGICGISGWRTSYKELNCKTDTVDIALNQNRQFLEFVSDIVIDQHEVIKNTFLLEELLNNNKSVVVYCNSVDEVILLDRVLVAIYPHVKFCEIRME